MPAFPPRSSIKQSLQRGQAARDAHAAGSVVIAGTSYECELHLGALRPETEAESGAVMLVQRGRAVISKSRMPSPPARDTVLRIGEVEFTVEDVGGHDAHEPSWVIPFTRIPPARRG